MTKRSLIPLLVLAALPNAFTQEPPEDIVVEVNVLPGSRSAGKFNQANITRDENRVLFAPFLGGPGCNISAAVAAPDGFLYFCGTLAGEPDAQLPVSAASTQGGKAFVARVTPDARTMTGLLLLPAVFLSADCVANAPDGTLVVAGAGGQGIAVARLSPALDALIWNRMVPGDRPASVAVAPDNSVVVCPETQPFVSRIAPEGSQLLRFGEKESFRIDGGNPDIVKAWWNGNGYPEAGYSGGVNYQRGGNAGVVALRDGTFVNFSCHFLRHPGGGPDFDPMLVRFDGNGNILWCTNLLDGLPAESDHKNPVMALDPHTGDILLAATQHGHFRHNFVFTDSAHQNPHGYITGNIVIGWIARIDPATGKPKAASYFFPEMPGSLMGGKKRANSLRPSAITSDASGNFYLAGLSGYKFETTMHAFQSNATSGSFLAVFKPDLSRIFYASFLASRGYELNPTGLAVLPGGPIATGNFSRKDAGAGPFETSNPEATNYLGTSSQGADGSFVNYTPSAPWLDF